MSSILNATSVTETMTHGVFPCVPRLQNGLHGYWARPDMGNRRDGSMLELSGWSTITGRMQVADGFAIRTHCGNSKGT